MSRHVGAAGTRFRLLNCGMSLLQGDVMPRSLAKHLLRRRIYSCCLDFFCADKIYPSRSGQALKEDVQVRSVLNIETVLTSQFCRKC